MARTAPVPNIPAPPGMNPGAFVAGGGGDGGGKGGKGGKNGNGEEGADGADGDEDADGDANAGDGCGAGAEGGCTNCEEGMSRGDPVDVISGNVFTVPKTDLYLPGLFDLKLVRSYSSSRRAVDVGLGYGWVNSLAWRIEVSRRTAVVRTGDGRRVELRLPKLGEWGRAGKWMVLRTEKFIAVIPGNEFVHLFSPESPGSSQYRLDFVSYRNRGRIALEYADGNLVRAVDTVGRSVEFGNTKEGRISSISVAEPAGHRIVFARFAYDSNGDLVSATDADGHTTRYSYDQAHRLVALTYPTGVTFHFRYDRADRCIETWGVPVTTSGLSPDTPKTLVDGTTAVKGIMHCRFEWGDGYSEVADAVRLQRFVAGPGGKIATAVGARGGVTSREFDDQGRVISRTDPTGGTTSYEYDWLDNVTREVDPDGNEVLVQRDEFGREVAIRDPEGGTTLITRDSHGEIVSVVEPGGGRLELQRDSRGQLKSVMDQRGGTHRYQFDAHGNVISRQFPNGAEYRFEYDYWGRRVREIDPQGFARTLTYSPSGLILQSVDRLGRVRRSSYNEMGHRVSEVAADGTTKRWEHCGFNWVWRMVQPDGSALEVAYNNQGWPLHFENEAGQRHSFEFEADGLLAKETEFHGRELRYTYDELGRMISMDEGNGIHEFEYSPAGVILSETGPDAETRTFKHNRRGELLEATNGDVKMTWVLDAVGNVLRQELKLDGFSQLIEGLCNPAGDRLETKTSLGLQLKIERDANGYVKRLTTPDGVDVGFDRNALEMETARQVSPRVRIESGYDQEQRLVSRRVSRPGLPKRHVEPEYVGRRSDLLEWAFSYTPTDEVNSITGPHNEWVAFEYDTRRGVTKRETPGRTEEFVVDSRRNYYEKGGQRVYDSGNRLIKRGGTSYEYDARGYLKRKLTAEGVWLFEWSPWGFLTAVVRPDRFRVEFDYDAFARRVAKRLIDPQGLLVKRWWFVWDMATMVHEVCEAEGQPRDVSTFVFSDVNDFRLVSQKRADEASWKYHVSDMLGSSVRVIDSEGNETSRPEQSFFGGTALEEADFRFPGQQYDAETGLHYNRYRYYDPETGTYLSPDPIGIAGGFNLYSYGPNPVAWADPMGWYHVMDVLAAPPGFQGQHQYPYVDGRDAYRSGYAHCPAGLDTPGCCHTEQKFATDLLASHRAGRDVTSSPFRVRGRLPPCPNCHAAMMRAASESGATINYEWEQPRGSGNMHTVTYSGSSAPTGTGLGNTIATGYTHTPDGTWVDGSTGGVGTTGPTQSWGYTYGGSWNTYYGVKNS